MAQFTDIVLSYFSCAAQKKNKTVYCDIQKIKDCAATSVFLFKNFTLDMCFFFFKYADPLPEIAPAWCSPHPDQKEQFVIVCNSIFQNT